MKIPINQDNYTNIITSLVNTAVINTEGVSGEDVLLTKPQKSSSANNVIIYFDDNKITIDVYIDVIFGYSVKDVACNLQEKIIYDVKENTNINVKNVNIIVNSVIFN